jgi:hypothetical protein
MSPRTLLSSPREACYEISKVAERDIGKLVARPWNMYEPDTTVWWLIPSTEWPAYKYGKVHFSWGDASEKSIFMSLYFEKGLSALVSSVYPCAKGSRYIMEEDWSWYRLIRDLENGLLGQQVTQLASNLSSPIELVINGGYVQNPCDRSFDPYAPKDSSDEYRFIVDAQSQQLILKGSDTKGGLLNTLARAKTFDDIPSILRFFDSNGWLWINFHFGIQVGVQNTNEVTEKTNLWNATDCWNNFLCHLSPWLV